MAPAVRFRRAESVVEEIIAAGGEAMANGANVTDEADMSKQWSQAQWRAGGASTS